MRAISQVVVAAALAWAAVPSPRGRRTTRRRRCTSSAVSRRAPPPTSPPAWSAPRWARSSASSSWSRTARRGIEHRGGRGRARAEGRLHAVRRLRRQHHQRGDEPQSDLRFHQGLRADHAPHLDADGAGGESRARREKRQGAGRARQGQARYDLVRLLRRGELHAPRARAAQVAGAGEDHARSLYRQPAGRHRSARRPHPRLFLARPRP